MQIWHNISYEAHDDLHNVVTNTNNAYLSTDGVIGARSIELQFQFSHKYAALPLLLRLLGTPQPRLQSLHRSLGADLFLAVRVDAVAV